MKWECIPQRGYLCRSLELLAGSELLRTPYRRSSQNSPKAKFGKGHRTGSLARIEVFGLLHAVLERKAGEGFFCRVAAEPCPLFFGDPESGFYPRLPLRRPREEVLRFLVEVLGTHHRILAHGALPTPDRPGLPQRGLSTVGHRRQKACERTRRPLETWAEAMRTPEHVGQGRFAVEHLG